MSSDDRDGNLERVVGKLQGQLEGLHRDMNGFRDALTAATTQLTKITDQLARQDGEREANRRFMVMIALGSGAIGASATKALAWLGVLPR